MIQTHMNENLDLGWSRANERMKSHFEYQTFFKSDLLILFMYPMVIMKRNAQLCVYRSAFNDTVIFLMNGKTRIVRDITYETTAHKKDNGKQ